MTQDEEPLHEFAEAFGALPAPPATRELSAEDEATRRAVEWMRAALDAQQPARDGLSELHARRAARLRPFAWRPLAAAAVLLVLLGGPLWLVLRGERAPLDTGEAPLAVAPPIVAPPSIAPADIAPIAPPTNAPATASPSGLVAVSEHALELRSGPVHLLLVLQPVPSREDSR